MPKKKTKSKEAENGNKKQEKVEFFIKNMKDAGLKFKVTQADAVIRLISNGTRVASVRSSKGLSIASNFVDGGKSQHPKTKKEIKTIATDISEAFSK